VRPPLAIELAELVKLAGTDGTQVRPLKLAVAQLEAEHAQRLLVLACVLLHTGWPDE
jgi:hypothetical protein